MVTISPIVAEASSAEITAGTMLPEPAAATATPSRPGRKPETITFALELLNRLRVPMPGLDLGFGDLA